MKLPGFPSSADRRVLAPQGLAAAGLMKVARSPRFVLAAILLFTFALYLPTLDDWFQEDDVRFFPAARSADVLAFTRDAFDFRDTSEPVPLFGGHYRPLHLVGWLIRYQAFGLEPLGYHVVNVTLHLANIALLWIVALKLTRRPLAAHIAALVFALHPAFTLSVAYVSAGTDLETLLACLVCLWLFMKYLEGGRWARRWYLASLAVYAVALLFHPKAAPLLVALAGYYYLVRRPTAREMVRPVTWSPLVPFAVMALFYLGIQLRVRDQRGLGILYGFGWHNARSFLSYVAIAPLPLWRQLIDASNPFGFPARSHVDVLVIGAIVLCCLVIWVVRLEWRRPGERALALVWFLASIVPLTTFRLSTWDRELYVPGPAWALLVGFFGVWVLDGLSRRRLWLVRALPAVILVVAVALASVHTVRYEWDVGRESSRWESLIDELRETYPVLPPGSTVYVADPPPRVAPFNDDLLKALVVTFYPGVDAVSTEKGEADALEGILGPMEYVFRYHGEGVE